MSNNKIAHQLYIDTQVKHGETSQVDWTSFCGINSKPIWFPQTYLNQIADLKYQSMGESPV